MKPEQQNIKLNFYLTVLLVIALSFQGATQKHDNIEEIMQEFFTGETVYAQEKKEIQFTLKPSYWKNEGFETINIPMQFEYGITDRLQVELTLPYNFNHAIQGKTNNGPGNVSLGILYNIFKRNKPFALSMALEVEMPTAVENPYLEATAPEAPGIEWEPSLIIARQFGRAQVHAVLAAEIAGSESSFDYNLATVLPFGNWRATLELSGKFNNAGSVFLTPGILWEGLDDFEFGFGISKGIAGMQKSFGVILMATHEFSLIRHNKQKN